MDYTVKEVSKRLGITPRAVQAKCKDAGLYKTGKSYSIPQELLTLWEGAKNTEEIAKDNEVETKHNEPDTTPEEITETFSPEQYDKLQEVIREYPNLISQIQEYKNEIEYLRTELKERSNQMDKLIDTLQGSIKSLHQTNYLQAKDKNLE